MNRTSALLACLFASAILFAPPVRAQAPAKGFTRVESGLDEAVKWKWSVEGTVVPTAGPSAAEEARNAGQPTPTPPPLDSYTVQKGDALAKISRKVGVSVEHIKIANGLKDNLIHPGDVLRIPGPEEIARMPKPAAAPAAPAVPGGASTSAGPFAAEFDPDALLLQIFLDRKNFSPGPIDGQNGLRFQKSLFAYQAADPSAMDMEALRTRARAEVPELFTTYVLQPEDVGFIAAPKAQATQKKTPPAERSAAAYRDMTGSPALLYRSPWEFVAERFHCSTAFLRALNPTLKSVPAPGSRFRVPNVRPFEIERALPSPLQPAADPANPAKAVIAELALLEIYHGDQLVAVFPVSGARPGLRGRGEWVVLDPLPMPRLVTRREPRDSVSIADSLLPGPLTKDEALPPGPRNPLGILWLNLAKAGDPTPLPFGLHGTSTPDSMATTESLGGFRLANWDIARAVRLLPQGTPLRWKSTSARPAVGPTPADTALPAVALPNNPPAEAPSAPPAEVFPPAEPATPHAETPSNPEPAPAPPPPAPVVDAPVPAVAVPGTPAQPVVPTPPQPEAPPSATPGAP